MKRVIRGTALLGLLLASVVAGQGSAAANPDRITEGEAQAVYNAAGNGGLAVLTRGGGRSVGAPADADRQVAIRPYFDSGLHYCVADWHVIVLAYRTDLPTMQQAQDAFAPVVFTFKLDGVELATERTPVKAFLGGDGFRYFFQQGRLMSPGDLTVGSHLLTMTSVSPVDPLDNFELQSQFIVDAAGTGVCL